MKKEPISIDEAAKAVLDRKGERSALKESERVMSLSEKVFLRELKEKGLEAIQKNHLDVWIVNDEYGMRRNEFSEQFIAIEDAHNRKLRESGDDGEEREYRFWQKDFGDFKYDLDDRFGRLENIREVPEMIILKAEKGEHDSVGTGIPNLVQQAVDRCVNNLYRYREDDIITHLGENLCCQLANKFDFTKVLINDENLIEYGLCSLEMVQREKQHTFFEKYILTGDEKYLREFFSDDVLREIYDFICLYDENGAYALADDFWGNTSEEGLKPENESEFFSEFKVPVDHQSKRAIWEAEQERKKQNGEYIDEYDDYDWEGEEVGAAIDNYLEHRKNISLAGKALVFDEIKEKMRATYMAEIKKHLDAYAPEYIRERDMFEAERKLLKPVLVHVSENPVQRELMRDFGAEVVLEKISEDEINGLLELVGKMKSSASSLMPEKLRRIKSDFYKSVEDKLDARSEITAETEKELDILQEIFQKNGNVKKVLDIACGNGRIDIPLLERGYSVTGIDANDQFLQSALKKAFEKSLSGATFKSGDVIDYRNVVERGSQDAVIYTWHSILEAFGVGNLLHTLGSGWLALRPGGVLVFDQPTRDNPHMEDGWYGNDPDGEHHYLSYIMNEEEIRFILKIAGFENIEIKKWTTQPNEEYPEGMHKFTVSAQKPDVDEDAKSATKMYRGIISQNEWIRQESRKRAEEDIKWADDFSKRKSA